MEELVKLVSEKTGLSQEQARQATEVVLNYLEDKLPPPIGGQLKNLLEGADAPGGNIADTLGGLLGKK